MWSKPLIAFIFFMLFIVYSNFKDSVEGMRNKATIVLVGDSMLNNETYVKKGESVEEKIKLRTRNVFNFAEDNSTINDCYEQVEQIPKTFNRDSTYIFVSAGGNDIINTPDITTSREKLEVLKDSYVKLIKHIKSQFPDANIITLNVYKPFATYYKMFYDVIDKWNIFIKETSVYLETKIANVERIIDEKDDLIYDIEPSEDGGEKIVNELISFVK